MQAVVSVYGGDTVAKYLGDVQEVTGTSKG